MFLLWFSCTILLLILPTNAILDQQVSMFCQSRAVFDSGNWTHYVFLLQLIVILIGGTLAMIYFIRRCWPLLRFFCRNTTATPTASFAPTTPHMSWSPPYGYVPHPQLGSSIPLHASVSPISMAPPVQFINTSSLPSFSSAIV
jgi:hypothetical protein